MEVMIEEAGEETNDDSDGYDSNTYSTSVEDEDEEDYKKYFDNKPCCTESEINYEFYSYETSLIGGAGSGSATMATSRRLQQRPRVKAETTTTTNSATSKCSPLPSTSSSVQQSKPQPPDRLYSEFSQFYENTYYNSNNTNTNRASPASFQPPPYMVNR